MKQSGRADSEARVLNVEGDLLALGALRRDMLPLYTRWINDLGALRTLLGTFLPKTLKGETKWYDEWPSFEKTVPFTVYARPDTIGYRHGVALRGGPPQPCRRVRYLYGDAQHPSRSYGIETTRLVLDYVVTVLGLHNAVLTVFHASPTGTWFRCCKGTLASHLRRSLENQKGRGR